MIDQYHPQSSRVVGGVETYYFLFIFNHLRSRQRTDGLFPNGWGNRCATTQTHCVSVANVLAVRLAPLLAYFSLNISQIGAMFIMLFRDISLSHVPHYQRRFLSSLHLQDSRPFFSFQD